MKKRSFPLLFLCVSVLIGTTRTLVGEELGEREAFALRWTTGSDWQAAPSVKADIDHGKLRLKHTGADTGWAAPASPVHYDRGSVLHVVVSDLENGQATIQIEWFDGDGKFLKAMTAIDRINESPVTMDVKLDDLIPGDLRGAAGTDQNEAKVQMVRVKLWIGGDGGRATLDDLTIRGPRRWRKTGMELVKALTADTPTTPDAGMRATVEEHTIKMQLDPDKKFAGLVFEPLLPFDEGGVVMLDLATLRGGRIGLQAVCFDSTGNHLGAVDLIKDADASGLHEAPLGIYRSAFPAGTKMLRYKIWLGGNNPTARVQGLFYGKPVKQ